MLAVVGFVTLLLVMLCLTKDKATPLTALSIIPALALLILGYNFEEMTKIINSGLDTVWETAVLFIFSVEYFSMMNDAGMFDKLVDALVKKVGNSYILLTVISWAIFVIGHLDGACATTILVGIPAMLPLYKKMHVRTEWLLLIGCCAMSVMNWVPWGGPVARVASVMEMNATDLWHELIPLQITYLIGTLIISIVIGLYLQKTQKHTDLNVCTSSNDVTDELQTDETIVLKRPKLVIFNICLTVIMLAALLTGVLPIHVTFMLALGIGVTVNYRDIKLAHKVIQKNAGPALEFSATLLAAGIFVGVLNGTGMIDAMINVVMSVIPSSLGKYFNIIFAIIGFPIGIVIGADSFYYGVLPIVGSVAEGFGLTMRDVAIGFLIAKNLGMLLSPVLPATYLLCGMSGVEFKDHVKFNFKYLWGLTLIFVIIAIVTGYMKIL